MSVKVPVKEYIASLETNAMIAGILALNMKNFATQIIQHVNSGGLLDETGLAALKAKCVRSLKNIAFGVRLWNKRQKP